MMKVRQMINSNGNGAMNQFIIDEDGKRVFQSYASMIIELDYNTKTVTVGEDYNYSTTTGKHRNIFFRDYTPLGGLDNLKALEKAMKDGNYNGWTIKTEGGCKMNKREMIEEVVKNMDDAEIVAIWNEYCSKSYRYDDEIFDAYTLEEMIENDNDTMNWLNRFYFGSDDYNENGSANPNRDYFTFNGYGNIISFDLVGWNQYSNEWMNMDGDELIDYIIENENALYNDDIQEILDDDEIED